MEDINCDIPCSGNNNQLCGGGWKMGIYSTGITGYYDLFFGYDL